MRKQVQNTDEPRRWFRGNLHMHSLWSDGFTFPELVAEHFKTAGYHFIAFTEHDRFQEGEKWVPTAPDTFPGNVLKESGFLSAYQARFGSAGIERAQRDGQDCVRLKPLSEYRALFEEPGRFLIMNGEEVTLRSQAGTHWVNVINAPKPIGGLKVDSSPGAAMNELAGQARRMERKSKKPTLVSLNHPNYVWNATAEDIVAATAVHCFEIHTALNCTWSYGNEVHPGAERIWDIVLAHRLSNGKGQPVYGIATDDCHAYYENCTLNLHEHGASMPCRAWIMVRAPQLTAESLITAIRSGDFYSSTGVTLAALESTDREIRLQIEPQPGTQYLTRFIGTRAGADLQGKKVAASDRITRQYSPQLGEVLAEARGVEARYAFRGDELYVRSLVLSTAPHPNPTIPGDVMKAWTQPVVLWLGGPLRSER